MEHCHHGIIETCSFTIHSRSVYLWDSSDIIVRDCVFKNMFADSIPRGSAISIDELSHSNKFTGNTISGYVNGIHMYKTTDTLIVGNNITICDQGIVSFRFCSSNKILNNTCNSCYYGGI